MSAPSAIIDSDCVDATASYFFVLETDKIWRTENITQPGVATWEVVWDSSSFIGTFGGLKRIKFAGIPGRASSVLYALGWGTDELGDNRPFILRSMSAGGVTLWSQHWVGTEELTTKDYTVTYQSTNVLSGYRAWTNFQQTHTRVGDGVAGTYNPWALAYRYTSPTDESGAWMGYLSATTAISVHANTSALASGVIGGAGNSLLASGGAAGYALLNDYFGVGGYIGLGASGWNMPKETARVHIPWTVGWADVVGIVLESWVFWNAPVPLMPSALGVGINNPAYVYVGLTDKIMASYDWGTTWIVLTSDHGANDICVDPNAAGAIYYWASDGGLCLRVLGALQGVLDTESALDKPLRIERDIEASMWVINSGTTLKRRNGMAWVEQKTGLVTGTGLHSYTKGKLIFVDSSDIYISDDYGATITAKKGAWAFAAGVNAHRLQATP